MDIKDINPEQYADIFATPIQTPQNVQAPVESTEGNYDMFSPSATETTTAAPSTTETTTLAPEQVENADIIGNPDDKPKGGRKPKYDFSDASGYFEDRIKAGKFVAVEEEIDGEVRQFIPRTPEEFDEFIEIQNNIRLQNKEKEVEQNWYASKSPAWQAVSKYSEMVDDPSELIPFLQGVRTIESVANIDENDAAGAERIIRTRLAQRGDSEDLIEEQIDSLRSTDRLVSTAQKYKPLILQEEQANLANMVQQQRAQEQQYLQVVSEIRDHAVRAIEAPVYGNQKLRQEEKAKVYDLIAEPSRETQGYGIFNVIDGLFERGDFETLTQVALLLSDKKAFFNYISTEASNKTAAGIQRTLRATTEGKTATGANTPVEQRTPTVQRNTYSTPRFGR